jgi:hypothetical protein
MLLLGGATTAFIVAGLLKKRGGSLKKYDDQHTEHSDSKDTAAIELLQQCDSDLYHQIE